MVVVLVVYLLANLSFLITLPASVLSNSKSVGYDFALIVGGHTFADVLSVMVAMTTMGAAHSTIFSASRVVFAAGRDGLFFGSRAIPALVYHPTLMIRRHRMVRIRQRRRYAVECGSGYNGLVLYPRRRWEQRRRIVRRRTSGPADTNVG